MITKDEAQKKYLLQAVEQNWKLFSHAKLFLDCKIDRLIDRLIVFSCKI